ncbi:MAG: hypothetical protein WBL61_14985 [Bryobacteraceae bacterium]
MKTGLGAALAISIRLLVAQTPSGVADAPTIPKITGVNPEILNLVIQDQWDRGNDMFGGRAVKPPESVTGQEVARRDDLRHAAVRKLLADGKLRSGKDYEYAALIFQHSGAANDLILAHTLAVTAVAKGEGNAKWLAAAAFDRYLHAVKQPQVFGTQFLRGPDGAWSMEPYDRTALSDSVRALWCIVPLAEQERILKDVRDGKPMGPTGISGCN